MGPIRPEVLAFKKAVEMLISADSDRLPLSDDEMEQVVDCLAKVEEAMQDGEL
jgi:hypothetical protein